MMISLPFTKMPLERSADKRKSEHWIKQQSTSTSAKYVLHYRGKFAFCSQFNLITISAEKQQKSECLTKHIYLGEDEYVSLFVIDASHLQESVLALELDNMVNEEQQLQWLDVRTSANRVLPDWLPILGFAKQLCHWHRSHQHCGYCGSPLADEEGGHAKKCTNINCQQLVFPRTDPVVIMLVEHTDSQGVRRCLLAGHQRTGGQVVSTLAGFVDPGESLEEGVIREIYEEAGLKATSVSYVCSQPWPFPASIMIGFRVQVSNSTLHIDENELTHAKWCTREEVLSFDDWGDDGDNTQIPSKLSIARYLIDSWCEEVNQ